jgi:hypothetical protein
MRAHRELATHATRQRLLFLCPLLKAHLEKTGTSGCNDRSEGGVGDVNAARKAMCVVCLRCV